MTFPEYELGTRCNSQIVDGVPEVVRHDVSHSQIILKLRKFYAHVDS